jgi:class 3 adenylate cyclase
VVDTLTAGREAVRRHAWPEALADLTRADEEHELAPDDLMRLGDAAWWSGDPDRAVEVFERAYAGYVRAGQPAEAAGVGALLAYLALRRMAVSVAGAWVTRIEHLLDGQPSSVGHAWLTLFQQIEALEARNDLDAVATLGDRAIVLGREHHSPGVQALAMGFKGHALIEQGRWREGLALIDEATIVAMSGEPDLRAACDVYCMSIAACRDLADYRRSGEWTEEAERWMRSQSVGGYSGICRVHRAELKRLRGSWPEAEKEARLACQELERYHILDGVGFAYGEIGEVRRRMGDLQAAEEAFQRAYEYGWETQPGLALLLLDRGETEEAAASIAARLDQLAAVEEGGPRRFLLRSRLLPAQVVIAIAAGDLETARSAAAGLEEIAGIYDRPAWKAEALTARGAVDLHEGRLQQAVTGLDQAWRTWLEMGLPYESARARTLLGQAREAAGDPTAARMEYRAARNAFQRLGAVTDLARVAGLLGEDLANLPVERTTKVFLFTDLVSSTDLIGVIGDAAWQELLRWHDRTLRAGLSAYGGEEVRQTGDGFFVTFDDPRSAVEWAVDVQRGLDEHRRQHGFAPRVRIGGHLAEASREGGDYAGQGVHVAARIGALADGEEILVSADLLEAAGAVHFATSEGRSVSLKGVGEPVIVHTVGWR